MRLRCVWLMITVAVLAVSCREPRAREYYLRADRTGEYSFDISLTDSLARYDISFYTAIVKPLLHKDTLASFPMQIVWRSPSGLYFSETVYYPAASPRVLYRSGLIPSEYGTWNIGITLPEEPSRLRGLGIICEKQK
ncbi:MAG: hypothetical protein J5737_00730 [Bacteroidales bacterium]|nr:hypothetical protein [Bacteroidales bacterium]